MCHDYGNAGGGLFRHGVALETTRLITPDLAIVKAELHALRVMLHTKVLDNGPLDSGAAVCTSTSKLDMLPVKLKGELMLAHSGSWKASSSISRAA